MFSPTVSFKHCTQGHSQCDMKSETKGLEKKREQTDIICIK